MKRFHSQRTAPSRHLDHSAATRKGGAVIIVVVSLLASLVFLGLFFYNWTSQELTNSEYFNDSGRIDIDPDPIFDRFLEDAIVGTNPANTQSVLHGSHHALLATILGTPENNSGVLEYGPHAYNGQGARITYPPDTDGFPVLTLDSDSDSTNDMPGNFSVNYGSTALDQNSFIVNFSAAGDGSVPGVASEFNSNAGYTYLDFNSHFLAFDDGVMNFQDGSTYRLVCPSYFRPQYFPARRASADKFGPSGGGVFEAGGTAQKVLRAHADHVNLAASDDRYVTSATSAQSGDRNRIIEPFPFENDVDGDGDVNEMGLYTTRDLTDILYEYDGDVDRDGIRDAILLDLGHSIINLPNGRQVVPMAMFKWTENDGLLNVNAHGNTQGLETFGLNINDGPYSTSNQGLSSFEVNLALGLTANPVTDRQGTTQRNYVDYNGMFGGDPGSRQAASNMDLLNLLFGRYEFQSDGSTRLSSIPHLGRYGDSAQLSTFQTWAQAEIGLASPVDLTTFDSPAPGVPGVTDDVDDLATYATYGHPLDYHGIGDATIASLGEGRLRRTTTVGQANYPSYNQGWTSSILPFSIQPGPRNTLNDEADETIVEPALRTSTDSLFPPAEQFALHGSTADQSRAGLNSRLQQLASFNFRDSLVAEEVRKRFTTDSWDRYEFSIQPRVNEFNTWYSDGSGTIYSHSSNPNEFFDAAFPPQFGDPSITGANLRVFGSLDPFRAPTRTLLLNRVDTDGNTDTISWGDLRAAGNQQFRLRLNRVLSGFVDGNPVYDRLTPHPLGISAAVPAGGTPEFNARQDRQDMARDIFVLLYALCGEYDAMVDPIQAANPYTDLELEIMAQFAVNVVDALDPDDVITRFEYDKNLSNGWNVDGLPYSSAGDSDRGFVDGVEAQQLTLSEVLFVHCEDNSSDDASTEWSDNGDRSFAYVELQNISPYDVVLDNNWKIKLEVDAPGASFNYQRDLILKTGTITAQNRYSIGTAGDDHNQSGMTPRPSYMRIDDGTMSMNNVTIVPSSGSLNMDLITNSATADFNIIDPASPTSAIPTLGAFFPPTVSRRVIDDPNSTITITLQRRTNVDRIKPIITDTAGDQDNPWIDVDQVVLEDGITADGMNLFDLGAGAVQPQIEGVVSRERRDPLRRTSEQATPNQTGAPPADKYNTLGDANSTINSNLWQPHFDRDFSSIAELLSVPVYGPGQVTERLTSDVNTMSGDYLASDGMTLLASVAGTIILDPLQTTSFGENTGNRWYRLLEFFDVYSQGVDNLSADIPLVRRVPGKINMNTVRDPSVLAGLIDDRMIERYTNFPTFNEPTLGFDGNRNWYRELIRTRDAIDHYQYFTATMNHPEIRIPGGIGSNPFRSNANFNSAVTDQNATQFRSHTFKNLQDIPGYPGLTMGVTNPYGDLRLFEARSEADVGADTVDFHTRHRILGKTINNSTIRSHVFNGWLEVVFHEAHEPTSGGVQIGARAEDIPSYRVFVVVDMSRLEEAYDPSSGAFDFNKFIIHRQLLP